MSDQVSLTGSASELARGPLVDYEVELSQSEPKEDQQKKLEEPLEKEIREDTKKKIEKLEENKESAKRDKEKTIRRETGSKN